MENNKVKIFISYAHDDETYFRAFEKGIRSHSKSSKNLKWQLWTDKEIPVGALWHNVIQEEIEECDAAILLVSANFLSSDYIENQEFQNFLQKNEESGFTFLPILLSDCEISQWEKLSDRQFFNPQGQDYGVESFRNKIVPYNYVNSPCTDTYHKNCVSAFEEAIKLNAKKNFKTKKIQENTNQIQNNIEERFQDFKNQVMNHIQQQNDKIDSLEKSVSFLIDEAYKGLEPIQNYSSITFDKKGRKYFFEFEKQFKVFETKGFASKFDTQFYANKRPDDKNAMIGYYKTNKISWEKLKVKAYIAISKTSGKTWSSEIEVLADPITEIGNYIPFTIKFEPVDKTAFVDKTALDIQKDTIIKIKYRYEVPIKLWGNYINRHLSYFKETLIVELKYAEDENLIVYGPELLEPPNGTPIDIPDEKFKVTENFSNNLKVKRIEFNGDKFEKYRIVWDAKSFFGKGEINIIKKSKDNSGLANR